ncbi:hypothetical protein OPU71_17410 [Niveibacterium sp. 24ML]|uniref:hypothetical protein n=1 Tax=Niveibacterium sp. 24ML TaxID=2985512 RepID=UPI0022703CD6|nr:hypothetical protein [Niveibacterium sp. 24ML]MCX9157905.1 hypothetical protein [Niveibacterium sp. 24ML]
MDPQSTWVSTIGPRQSLLLWNDAAWRSHLDGLLELALRDEPAGLLSRLMVTLAREAIFDGETLQLEPEQAERFRAEGATQHSVSDDLVIVCREEDFAAVAATVLAIARKAGYTESDSQTRRTP